MKKIIIGMLVAVFCLAGCATSAEQAVADKTEVIKRPVVLGKDGIPQPDWVYKDVSTQDVHFAVGYGKLANFQNSQKRAMAEARNLLAEWVSISVEEIITNYTNDAGESSEDSVNRQALDAFETISKQSATAWLSGSKQEDLWIDADGGVYILVSIPVANVADQMKQLSEKVNDKVFKENKAAKKANDMMDDAFDKYFGVSSSDVAEEE